MTTDPSWLYSTIAQSSAAIVAIVGGFITASVLNLLSEKRSLKKQLSEKEAQTKNIREKSCMLQNLYDTKAAEYFLKKELKAYSDDKLPTLDEIFSKYPTDYRKYYNEKILYMVFINLSLKQIKATMFIIKHSEKVDMNNYDSFLEWTKKNVKTDEYIEICNEYNKYFENRKKLEAATKEERTFPPWAALPWPSNYLISTEKVERDMEEERHESEQENIRNNIEKHKDQLSSLNGEVDNLKTQLDSFYYPPYLRLGAIILLLFAFGSILLPVSLLLNEVFSSLAREITFYIFLAGLVAVFSYITLLIIELRRH